MKMLEQSFAVNYKFPVVFTRDTFNINNLSLPQIFGGSGRQMSRILTIVDANLYKGNPGLLGKIAVFADHYKEIVEFVTPPLIYSAGELCKKDSSVVDSIHALVERHGICRHSFILAIGGGALLDAVGYASATAHRGIRLIRMPTTVLGQNDAGIGVKNGINAYGRKNFLGTFSPPFAVINDFDFLRSLPERDLRAGISEAVKVSLINDRQFFDFLYSEREKLATFTSEVMERMIVRSAELHMEHIATSGDPFEFGSARPLDFGHWIAHKLEELTAGEIRHGEAVAIGVALDSFYSFYQGLISEIEIRRILATLEGIGFELYHPALSWIDIGKALREFQEHLGGMLSIPLLAGIGNKIEAHEVDTELYRKCITLLGKRKDRKKTIHDRNRDNSDVKINLQSLLS